VKRKGLLLVTGCAEKRFDTLNNREQLPFSTGAGRWADYSLDDAFRLRVMLTAVDQAGLNLENGLYLAVSGVGKLSMHPLNYPESYGAMWVAVCTVTEPDPEVKETHWRFAVAGRQEDLAGLAAAHIDRNHLGSKLVAMVAVNASEAALHVRDAARDIGLPESDDYSPVWENWQWPSWVGRDK
jgi:hypothetical protein